MTPRKELLERLKSELSPFATQAAPSPWENTLPDVPTIHGKVHRSIAAVISQLKREPGTPVSCLLVGQAGSGKTHLLGQLCKGLDPAEGSYSFAHIQPLIDPTRPLRHVVNEIVSNLIQRPPRDVNHTQLERISARTMSRFFREKAGTLDPEKAKLSLDVADTLEKSPGYLPSGPRDAGTWKRITTPVRNWLMEEHPRIWGTCLRVFFQLRSPGCRAAVIQWLKGEIIDEEEAELLGLQYDESGLTPEGAESRAGRTLETLGILLRYDRPLVVCFDQLENVDTPEKIHAFEQMILHLFNFVPSMLILCCVRGDWWNGAVKEICAPAVERLESNRHALVGCDEQQAMELIASRLKQLDLPEGTPTNFPLDGEPEVSRLREILSQGTMSPRLVLQRANQLWNEAVHQREVKIQSQDPIEVLKNWWKSRRELILQNLDRYGPSEGMLTEVLSILLRLSPEKIQNQSGSSLKGRAAKKYVDLCANILTSGGHSTVAFLIDVEPHHKAVGASFRNGMAARNEEQVDRLVFLRDARVAFPDLPKWPATNALKKNFLASGGVCFSLDLEEVADWYALLHLKQAVTSEDIDRIDSDGASHVVSLNQFEEFVQKHSPGGTKFSDIAKFCMQSSSSRPDSHAEDGRTVAKSVSPRAESPGPEEVKPIAVPSPPPAPDERTEQVDDETQLALETLLRTLAQRKCDVHPKPPICSPRMMRFRVVPDLETTSVAKIESQAANLQVAMELPTLPLIQAGMGHVSIDVPRKKPTPLFLEDALTLGAVSKPHSCVAFPLGMAVDGRVIWADLSDSTMTSMLVGGTSGSGKSEFLKSVVISLSITTAPDKIRFTLVDPKRVTFTGLKGLPHIDGDLIFEPALAIEKLQKLVLDMENRYKLFAEKELGHIEEYKEKVGLLAHHVILIDEYSDLMTDKESRQILETAIQRIGQMGRAAGYHLILATQRPDANVINGTVKANLQVKVGLKVATAANSRIILDQGGAESLLGNGDMLVGGAIPTERLQAPLSTKDDLMRAFRWGG